MNSLKRQPQVLRPTKTLSFLLAFCAARVAAIETGPEVGARIPDFTARDQTGATRNFEDLRGTNGLMAEQLNDLVEVAITESERFYPAFQYVVWAGKSPADALTASILETVGEA